MTDDILNHAYGGVFDLLCVFNVAVNHGEQPASAVVVFPPGLIFCDRRSSRRFGQEKSVYRNGAFLSDAPGACHGLLFRFGVPIGRGDADVIELL